MNSPRLGHDFATSAWQPGVMSSKGLSRARGCAILVAGWLGFGGFLVWHGARARAHGGYDAIVVAGCRVQPDGTPSRALARRVERAAELHRAGLAPKIFTTGG
ncbi:MAG: hypothetical protein H5U40_08770, partial [Polyangiaceae bacterium]|nr:hypothetical protein [Polyangiaceae bacterium]